MKSFIIATLLAVSAFAAEQGVAPTPVERAPADAMWTNEQIKDWVSINHGGYEWGAFEQNQLLTDESRQAFVGTMITNMVEEWQTSQNYLPNVCEPGIACRAEVNRNLVMDLEALWKQMLVTIDAKITSKKASVDIRLVEFYEEAYDCVPGCECENIYIEYDQLIKWQTDLSTRIVEYTSNLNGLITNEQQIIASCPAYIYDSDGNAFFDFSGNGASETVTEESSTTTETTSTATYTVNGVDMTEAQYNAYQATQAQNAAALNTQTSSSSSTATYTVNGVDMTEAEYNAYQAEQAAADTTQTSSSSSSATYSVGGQDMTQAEYDMYMAMSRDEAAEGDVTTTTERTYNVDGTNYTEAEYNALMAAQAAAETSSSSEERTYSVNGTNYTEAEYNALMAAQAAETSSSSEERTYTVNGTDMTEAEYDAYMSESGFTSME